MLPWYSHAKRSGSLAIDDCGKCMERTSRAQRQSLACGYEPASKSLPIRPWDHEGRKSYPGELDERGVPRVQLCAGYVCNLPEVIEVARAHMHWSKGQIESYCGGMPNEHMLTAIEVLEMSVADLKHWDATKEK